MRVGPDPPFLAPERRPEWSVPTRLAAFGLLFAGAYLGSRVLGRYGVPAPKGFLGVAAVLAFGVRLVRDRLRRSEATSGVAPISHPPIAWWSYHRALHRPELVALLASLPGGRTV